MTNTIKNTTKTEQNPEWLLGGNPDAIEAQEARGQAQLAASTQLPTRISPEDKIELEEAGVIFGDVLEDDPIFCEAVLPAGWEKVPTDHPLWTNLVDDKGVVRAEISYKAAFYGRRASMRVVHAVVEPPVVPWTLETALDHWQSLLKPAAALNWAITDRYEPGHEDSKLIQAHPLVNDWNRYEMLNTVFPKNMKFVAEEADGVIWAYRTPEGRKVRLMVYFEKQPWLIQ